MNVSTIVAIFIVSVVVWTIIGIIKNKSDNHSSYQELKAELRNIKNFIRSQQFISKDFKTAIAIDDKKKKICLISLIHDTAEQIIIPYKDILSSEIVEDESSLTKTARGSQVGGALVGGILLGGAGAIIGGLSGKKHQINKAKRIDLLIVINNTKSPIFKINFLMTNEYNNPNGYDKNNSEYISFFNDAKKWHSLMAIIIKNADEVDNKQSSSNNTSLSISDEIRKLKALKDDGLITDDEFISQKNKLLSD